jgi:exopolysaccharide production protein ExoZ
MNAPQVPPAIVSPAPQRVLLSVQYLRAAAALLVVFHHARNPAKWLDNPITWFNAGAAGVDIFFVISGFIMLTAAGDEPIWEFYRRRILRIVPLYWLATGVVLLIWFFDHHVVAKSDILRSLLFIPYYNRMPTPQIWPLLVPGWTLNYEMFFYLIFGFALRTRRILMTTTAIIVPLVLLGFVVHFRNAIFETYTSQLMLEFLAGVYVAQLFRTTSFQALKFMLPLGFGLLLASDLIKLPHTFGIGVPAVMILVGALAFERTERNSVGGVRRYALPKLLGDASYAIYLFHTILLASVTTLVRSSGLAGITEFMAYVGLCIFSAIAVGIIVHKLVERPLLRRLNSMTAGVLKPRFLPA